MPGGQMGGMPGQMGARPMGGGPMGGGPMGGGPMGGAPMGGQPGGPMGGGMGGGNEFEFRDQGPIGLGFADQFMGGKVEVKIASINPGSPAQNLGVPMGSVVTAINGRPVDNMNTEAVKQLILSSGRPLKLSVRR